MSWLYEHRLVPSEVNGTIECVRFFRSWQIVVRGCGQATPFLNSLWREAFQKLPREAKIKRILMLGLATGGALREYHKRFPDAHITAIEIDPVMVKLMETYRTFEKTKWPEILIGDAFDVLPTLTGPYDLVVVDMFLGVHVAPAARHERLVQDILRVLDPHGSILFNAYKEPDAFDAMAKHCALIKKWKCVQSHVALFRPWGSGTVGDPLPEGYTYHLGCSAFIEREFSGRPVFGVAHAGSVTGIRRFAGPLTIDQYIGEEEPTHLPKLPGLHITLWQPLERSTIPPGWRRWITRGTRRLTGFAKIPAEGPYDTPWSEHAKRHIKRWQKQTSHEIRDVDTETYIAAFERCGKRRSLVQAFSGDIRHKAKAHGDRLRLRAAIDKTSGDVVAGFASLWIPEIKQTFHLTSFITPTGRDTPAAFGLVNDAFSIAQSRGDRFFEFDGFWAPGDPPNWKGFSRFKDQFGVYYVLWPRPLVRVHR